MEIRENVQLAPFTTFKIGGPADYFCVCENEIELIEALTFAEEKQLPVIVLGGGSNMLVSDSGFRGLVIHFTNKGFDVISQDAKSITLRVASGEVWDEVVQKTVENNWWGIENLSHIPGLVGGFSVQNVGAYGQEASQVVQKVVAMDMGTKKVEEFSVTGCLFTYRKSMFNTISKGRYVILQTYITLNKEPSPNLSYGDVKEYFVSRSIENPTQQQVRQAIVEIRNKKFPYPRVAKGGNAGSFFRGPLLSADAFMKLEETIQSKFGEEAFLRLQKMQDRLKVPQGYKTPGAFILDICGLKGLQVGGAQVNPPQPAIVLNSTGTATAKDVLSLYREVQNVVGEKLGLKLEIEPELVGFNTEDLHDIISI